MAVGDTLHRIARSGCSPALCGSVLEPAIADLQHQCAHAGRVRLGPLLGAYAAFWWSFLWCLARDAAARESRAYLARAATAFAMVVGAMAASEALLLRTVPEIREAALHTVYLAFGPYVGWSARLSTATLLFGIPVAMCPALMSASRRRAPLRPAAALLAIALGTLLTIASSGWIAPAVVRWDTIRQHDRFVADTGGRYFIRPIAFEDCPDCQAWPGLMRGAVAPLKHRYPGYANYVAPEDRNLPQWYRSVLRERLLLVAFATLAGLAGWWLGIRSPTDGFRWARRAKANPTAGTTLTGSRSRRWSD